MSLKYESEPLVTDGSFGPYRARPVDFNPETYPLSTKLKEK